MIRIDNRQIIGGIIVASVAVMVIYLVTMDHGSGGEFALDCTLPTECPMMTAPSVNCPSINNTTEAKLYAVQYFPEFADDDFLERDWDNFRAELSNASVRVFRNGMLSYTKFIDDVTYVDIDDFPIDEASLIAEKFIMAHGGMGEYSENQRGSIGAYDDDGPTGEITSHTFIYHRQYNAYTIYGADRILVSVDPDGPSVATYLREVYPLGESQLTQQVISATMAWESLSNVSIPSIVFSNIRITSVELCYYIEGFDEVITTMYPAWAFSSDEGLDFYVNAFTGEYME